MDELCNGIDDDCDGLVDELLDTRAWYQDLDGDGHGDPAVAVEACAPPDGYVPDGDDCGPNDGDVHPGARERCDDVDQDCDGAVDDVAAGELRRWYADADGDGFGDPAVVETACLKPDGHVDDALDCDDTRADVSPAAPEVCDDADTDEDCDGAADEADDWQADGEPMYVDADDDRFGAAGSALVWRCAPGPGYATRATDCLDRDPHTWPGAPEVCDGVDNDCDGTVDEEVVDLPRWFFDADADGFGDATRSFAACVMPPNWVADPDDCDDTDPSRHPGAPETDCADPVDYNCDGQAGTGDFDGDGEPACAECDDEDAAVCVACDETCDGRDDDCDGTVDEPDAVDARTWYHDRDGDGVGSTAHAHTSCDRPPGHSELPDDCDDAQATAYPGAPETCGDGLDQDCDGVDPRCMASP